MRAKDDGSGDERWSYTMCKAAVKSAPQKNQMLNTELFTGRMPFLSPNQQCDIRQRP